MLKMCIIKSIESQVKIENHDVNFNKGGECYFEQAISH